MDNLLTATRSELIFALLVFGFSLGNELLRFRNQMYYTKKRDFSGVYNRQLNIDNNYHLNTATDPKKINMYFFLAIMAALAIGLSIACFWNILVGFAVYMILYKLNTWCLITCLVRSYQRELLS